MKSRWFRVFLALFGVVGAMTAGALTAAFTAERVQVPVVHHSSTSDELGHFEPQEYAAQID